MITIHNSTASNGSKVRVTFSMPGIDGCDRLYLVGWFSEWDEGVYPMERTLGGGWSLTLELEAGCTYHYRFRTLDGRWLSDPARPSEPAGSGLNRSFIISRNSLAGRAAQLGSAPPS
jgi:predicted carbohydrate-binding protein with CBM48